MKNEQASVSAQAALTPPGAIGTSVFGQHSTVDSRSVRLATATLLGSSGRGCGAWQRSSGPVSGMLACSGPRPTPLHAAGVSGG